jgi:hypothetical protein
VVKGVAHLNTIQPRPHSTRGSEGSFNPQTKRLEQMNATSTEGPKANFTGSTTSDPYFLYITPGDAATIYDTPNSFNLNFSGTSYTGSGVKIGIGGDATIKSATVVAYRRRFLGDSTAPTIYYADNVTSTTDSDEAYIDTELSGGLAPGASIYYYASTDLNTGIEAAIDANVVDIFSLSFGECEQEMNTSGNAQINGYWEQAATQGIAVTVSTGDSGSAGCDDPNKVSVASGGLQVSGFASTPYNIAVGGTDFYALTSSSYSTYASTSQGSSSTYYRTALKYIPESAWNESSQTDTTISANVPWTGKSANIWAGSGGISSCASGSGSTCTGYSKPSWQTGTGVPSDGVRDIPDVSLMSGSGYDPATWLVCSDDTTTGNSNQTVTTNCTTQSDNYFYFVGYGGTSTAAPAFAGILALVQQKTGSRLGQAAKTLYELYNSTHASLIFHDVTVGNISVPCTSGTTDCKKNNAGSYFESGYDTASGYDLATGIGSVDAKELLTYWSTAYGTTTTATVTVSPASSSITTADSLSVPVTVTGSSAAPTGTITLSGGGYTSGVETLSTSGTTGSYTFTIPAGDLSTGTDTLTAIYNGDGSNTTYGIATGSATVTVTSSTGSTTPTFGLSATAVNVTKGSSSSSTVTVTPTNFTGTVTLTCAVSTSLSSVTDMPTCSGSTVTISSSAKTGTVTVYTTAASSSALAWPKLGNRKGWAGAGSGAVLALLMFWGIPARSRNWRSMLSILVVMIALGGLAGCGSSVSGSSSTSGGTTSGTYTVTVTGTGTDSTTSDSVKETTTFTLTVN